MLDSIAAPRPDGVPAADLTAGAAPGRRVRALAACAVLVVALHLAFLDSVGGGATGPGEPAATSMSVRAIVPERAPEVEAAAVARVEPEAVTAPSRPAPPPQPRSREPQPHAGGARSSDSPEASASSPDLQVTAKMGVGSPSAPASEPAGAVHDADPGRAAAAVAPSATATSAASPALAGLAGASDPPPVYRTVLPPAATIRYQVRRGGLRGEGEIRWRPGGDGYRLALEARISGLTLLLQTSEGSIDANGLAPVRFLDQRARRPAQAANFVRDAGRITYSGSGVESPLFAGSQDRLSWMLQLAGIAAAEPQLLTDGGQITMAVVGARGDASIWVLRYAGLEDVGTAHGTVRAVKLVRQGRSPYDTTAEIWLDPERFYLPVRATLRNDAGTSEYELLLDRIEPGQ